MTSVRCFRLHHTVFILLLPCFLLLAVNCGSGGDAGGDAETQSFDIGLTLSGPGTGSVTSAPTGIDCGETCTAAFASGTAVTLTTSADAGFVFAGWVGDGCSGTAACTVTLAADANLTAPFNGILFASKRQLDGTDSLSTNSVLNIWSMKTDGTQAEPLTSQTTASVVNTSPKWSPDRTKIVYRSNRALDGSDALNTNSTTNIWVMDADGGNATPLTLMTASNAGSSGPIWSPDGSQIAFSSNRALDASDTANTGNTTNIWIIDAAGTGLTALTNLTTTGNSSPQWSPDGTKIVYSSTRALDGSDALNPGGNIWVMDIDGENNTPFTNVTSLSGLSASPSWSPDGTQILYTANHDLTGADGTSTNLVSNIWVIDADGSHATPLTNLTTLLTHSFTPVWSPDGSSILFNSSRALDGSDALNTNGDGNLWIIDADGTNLTALTSLTATSTTATDEQWSPDGLSVIYRSNRAFDGTDATDTNSVYNIWLSSADGATDQAVSEITTAGADSFLPGL